MRYLGYLPKTDPLYGYLKHDIQPQLNGQQDVDYRVFRLGGSNDVFLYEEKWSGSKVVGKFFHSPYNGNTETAYRHLRREYDHLNLLRAMGFDGYPHAVPRPLGCNAGLNYLLLTEHCGGVLFDDVLTRAIQHGNSGLLFDKLTSLAWFLARQHNQTADWGQPVWFPKNIDYFDTLIRTLQQRGIEENPWELYALRDAWRYRPEMGRDASVLVHGDATPANFLFGGGRQVIGLDLERLHRTDRVFDTGRVAGEIAHAFLLKTGDRRAAERFIGHFLWEYACHFPDRQAAFDTMNRRVPFYMGMTFLRIARNNWLNRPYRHRLVHEAKICLKGGLK